MMNNSWDKNEVEERAFLLCINTWVEFFVRIFRLVPADRNLSAKGILKCIKTRKLCRKVVVYYTL